MPEIQLQRIGVVVGPQKPDALDVVSQLVAWCAERRIELRAPAEIAQEVHCETLLIEAEQLAEDIDLMVVLGGDGTMLGAARLIGTRRIPVLGVNLGYLGYLTEFTLDEMFTALEDLRAGNFQLDRRMMLDVSVEREGTTITALRALNDAVINQNSLARMIELVCLVNGDFVNRFRADGMIVSTPTGSTAYSLSAGGPIVYPLMSAIIITPICPHTLSNRPVLVPGEAVVELLFKKANDGVILTIDGQRVVALEADDRVILRRSETTVAIVRPSRRNYFEVLRTKLKWGSL